MNSKLKKYTLIVLLPFIMACDDGNGKMSQHTVLSSFDIIEFNSVFEVYLTTDSIFSIKIEGHENTVKNISFNVEDSVLRVRNNARLKWLTPEDNRVKLYISSNHLREIRVKEMCYIETINTLVTDNLNLIIHPTPKLSEINMKLDCKQFFYWNNHQCGGKLTLSGKSNNLLIYSFALMSVDARALDTDYALVENNSKGDCEVMVRDKIEYSIRGTGNIYLYGAPKEIVLMEKMSTGKLIKAD